MPLLFPRKKKSIRLGLTIEAGGRSGLQFNYLLSVAEDDVGVAAVGERVADGQVHSSHHPHLEQP